MASCPAGGDRPAEHATTDGGCEQAPRGRPAGLESMKQEKSLEHGDLHQAGEGLRASQVVIVDLPKVVVEVERGRGLGAGGANGDVHAERSGRAG